MQEQNWQHDRPGTGLEEHQSGSVLLGKDVFGAMELSRA